MQVTKSADDLRVKQWFKTTRGRWLRVVREGDGCVEARTDLGVLLTYYDGHRDLGDIVAVQDEKPMLRTGEAFSVVCPRRALRQFINALNPGSFVVFVTDNDFRFRVQLQHAPAKLCEIPFRFPTADPRAPWGEAVWSITSGQVWRHIVGERLYISYDLEENAVPKLHVMARMTIPSQ